MFFNDNLKQEQQEKKNQEDATYRKDKLDFFPFTSGDLIEKHRASLGAQLKNDLRSYMDYTKTQYTNRSPRSVRTSKFNTQMDSVSQVSSVFTSRDKKFTPMKLICDTDYIRPEERDCVQTIEKNPKLRVVNQDAIKRFEDELTGKKKSR